MRKITRYFVVLATLAGTPLAAVNNRNILPNLGDAAQADISPQDERKMGEAAYAQLQNSGAILDDPEITSYLNELGYKLVAASADPSQTFKFFVVNDNQINAFALPGGFIGVHTGLIAITQSESELASVLAHEIAHVTQRHLVRILVAQNRNTLLTLGAMIAAILASRGNGQTTEAALIGGQAALLQSQINFTREHEYEADRLGYQTLEKSAFDTRAMVTFLERMQRATRLYEDSTFPSYLRTHPASTERIAEAQNRALNQPYRQVTDSLDFHLVRSLVRSYQGTAQEAVAYFEESLAERKYNQETAAHYGLAAALLRAEQYQRAETEVQWLQEKAKKHPMIEALIGQILLQSKQYPRAISHYTKALQSFPNHKQLLYDYPEALLKGKQNEAAIVFIHKQLALYPNDAKLHQLAAQSYAALGKKLLQHRHQGEYYALLGLYALALDQFELARKADDGDFYQQSALEAKLRETKKKLAEQKKELSK